MMDLLQAIFRGATDRERYEDFSRRYESGHPGDGYSDAEVLRAYHEVSELLSSSLYCRTVTAALERLSPDERRGFTVAFLRRCRPYLKYVLDACGRHLDRRGTEGVRTTARLAADLQRLRPGALGQVLTEEHLRGVAIDRPTKAVLAGITAHGVRHFLVE
jgi:hypothetical protein